MLAAAAQAAEEDGLARPPAVTVNPAALDALGPPPACDCAAPARGPDGLPIYDSRRGPPRSRVAAELPLASPAPEPIRLRRPERAASPAPADPPRAAAPPPLTPIAPEPIASQPIAEDPEPAVSEPAPPPVESAAAPGPVAPLAALPAGEAPPPGGPPAGPPPAPLEIPALSDPLPEVAAPPPPAAALPPLELDAPPPAAPPEGGPAAPVGVPFPAGSSDLPASAPAALAGVAADLSADPGLRLQLRAYADAGDGTSSAARRLSLLRALAVRAWLLDAGVDATRIDVRALGAKYEGGSPDRVDIVAVR